jgi:hypothetical protein
MILTIFFMFKYRKDQATFFFSLRNLFRLASFPWFHFSPFVKQKKKIESGDKMVCIINKIFTKLYNSNAKFYGFISHVLYFICFSLPGLW